MKKLHVSLFIAMLIFQFVTISGAHSQPLIIDSFQEGMLSVFLSSDPGQFSGHLLTGANMDTEVPGMWRIFDGKLDPPQGSFLDGLYCPMFEQIIDQRIRKNVRIRTTFFTGIGYTTHPGILFRGTDPNTFGWLYIRPHWNAGYNAVVLSSASNGFISNSAGGGSGPHFEGLGGYVDDVGFNRIVEMVLEISNDVLNVDINGVRRISNFNIAGAGYASAGMSGVAICDNNDPETSFLSFSATPLARTISIDIKPGSYPNSINLSSRGTVPVAILSTPEFDASTVIPNTILFAGAPVEIKRNGKTMSSLEDVNADGLLDMVVHVRTEALQLTGTETEAVLTGETKDGDFISGKDTVTFVPR